MAHSTGLRAQVWQRAEAALGAVENLQVVDPTPTLETIPDILNVMRPETAPGPEVG